jgi:hypothetical protein
MRATGIAVTIYRYPLCRVRVPVGIRILRKLLPYRLPLSTVTGRSAKGLILSRTAGIGFSMIDRRAWCGLVNEPLGLRAGGADPAGGLK